MGQHCAELGNHEVHRITYRILQQKNWQRKRSNKRITKEPPLTIIVSTILLGEALVGCSFDAGLLLFCFGSFFVVTRYFEYLIIMNSFSIDCSGSDHKELIWHAMNVICIHIKKLL